MEYGFSTHALIVGGLVQSCITTLTSPASIADSASMALTERKVLLAPMSSEVGHVRRCTLGFPSKFFSVTRLALVMLEQLHPVRAEQWLARGCRQALERRPCLVH
mmetsp:Transcript_119244/g.299869  ORF Transcript_119244/g.299869 Transcript_119244/m.299869 type:complete len:105 (-) Transcript_119244:29-343(-)